MKYKANGGYQILNFEGVNVTSLTSIDFNVVKSAILREKTIQVINLVVGTEKVNGVADASYDATNNVCVLTIALKVIEIASDSTLTISDVKTGTEVIANPVGATTVLTSLQIGDDKYFIDTSYAKPLYAHNIEISLNSTHIFFPNSKAQMTIILPTDAQLTDISVLGSYLKDYYLFSVGSYTYGRCHLAFPISRKSNATTYYSATHFQYLNDSNMELVGCRIGLTENNGVTEFTSSTNFAEAFSINTTNISSVTDNVVELKKN